MTVAYDFDGVIHWYRKGWQGGKIYDEPVPGAIEAVRETMLIEPAIVLTARQDLEAVASWLSGHGLPAMTASEYKKLHGSYPAFWGRQDVLLVTNCKLPARAYLDDRGVTFNPKGGWDKAMSDLGFAPREQVYRYLVTVKLPKNPEHNPRSKVTGPCPVNGEPCTDVTGEHHTIRVRSTSLVMATLESKAKYGHVTRVESVSSGNAVKGQASGPEQIIRTLHTPDVNGFCVQCQDPAGAVYGEPIKFPCPTIQAFG